MSSALTVTEIASIAVAANSLSGGGVTNALGFGGSNNQPGGGTGTGVAAAADPFAVYRGDIAKMYAGALQPGTETDITKMPGFTQFQTGVMDPALEASKRSSAASGMLRSGNEQLALQNTAQKGYYGFMTDYLNRLAQGSGAANNPATAVGMGVSQGNLNNQGVMQGFGGAVTTLAGAYNNYNSSPGYTVDTTGYGMGSYGDSGGVNTADYGGASGYSIR